MSTMSGINTILGSIRDDLQAIDLTKETDLNKIQKMGTEPIGKVESVVTKDGFGVKELKTTVDMFKEANDKLVVLKRKQNTILCFHT